MRESSWRAYCEGRLVSVVISTDIVLSPKSSDSEPIKSACLRKLSILYVPELAKAVIIDSYGL